MRTSTHGAAERSERAPRGEDRRYHTSAASSQRSSAAQQPTDATDHTSIPADRYRYVVVILASILLELRSIEPVAKASK